MDIRDEKLVELKEKAELEYKEIGSVFCPYFQEDVNFNAKGLEHIKFKGRNKARSHQDQYIRLRCLSLAPKIISLSHTLQGYQERNEMVNVKSGKWKYLMKSVNYFEFVAVLKEVRVRIIVRKVGSGEPDFWSIIPFWRMDKFGNRLIHSGNPSED